MATAAELWTTGQIVSLVAGSSVVAAGVTVGVTWVRDWVGETRDGKFAALYLAIALERWAETCSTALYDSHNYDSSSGNAGRAVGQLDPLPEYPDVNWKALGIDDTMAVLAFRTEVDWARSQLDAAHEFDDSEDIVEQARFHIAAQGLAAARLAVRLRRDKRLDPIARDFAEVHLRESSEKYSEQRKRQAS